MSSTKAFQIMIAHKDWANAADIVRRYTKSATYREINEDGLCDWIAEGQWKGDETPEAIAKEWDDNHAD
jgi:hypothetical protein